MLSYKIAQVASFLRFSSFNSNRFLNQNERYKTGTNLFMNINNNTAPFVSITWLQKGPLGCVVYSHCPTNDSCNKYIHSCCCCLPCNYVAKPFGILQRIIQSQKVCMLFGHSKSRSIFSQKSLWLNFKQEIMPMYAVFKKKMFLRMRKCFHISNCSWKFSHTLSNGFTS